jgi:pimeloyl-ACP methyl ester carboxylesterase
LRSRPDCNPEDECNPARSSVSVLADRHRRFGSAVVLGGRRARRACCRPEASAGVVDPVRLHDVPGRDLADAAQLGRASYPNVVYFHEVDKGGHFAAWEERELFATELRTAFRSLR